MLKLLVLMFLQFFHVGVFSFGGGYATLPFLYEIAEQYGWYSTAQLTDMFAISSLTPGPIGVNMATYAGFATNGILGAFTATLAIMLPSLIIVSIVYKVLDKFKTNSYVEGAVKALKPAGCALLTAVGVKLIFTSDLYLIGTLVLIAFLASTFYKKFDPVFYLGVSGLIGLIAGIFNLIGI